MTQPDPGARDERRPTAPNRPMRRCARCGREGRNAFRPARVGESTSLWICSHEEPCAARWRMLRRAADRLGHGRPRNSPIVAVDRDDRRACVIGSEPRSRAALAGALADLAAVDVETLDLTRRSLDVLGSRDFGLIIADVHASDPVALLDGLGRRLTAAQARGASVVVSHGPADIGPAVRALIVAAGTYRISRPLEVASLIGILTRIPDHDPRALAG